MESNNVTIMVTIKNHELIAMWNSLKIVLESGVKTPYEPSEMILMMEHLAKKQKTVPRAKIRLNLAPRPAKMIWECINTCINENAVNSNQVDTFFDAQMKLAATLDSV